MKLNKFSIATLVAVTTISLPLGAMALDARDFADKLSAAISVSSGAGYEIKIKEATANGDVITLSGWEIEGLEEEEELEGLNEGLKYIGEIFNRPIVFFGVKETEDGGYSATKAEIADIDHTIKGINIKASDIAYRDILIPANAEEDFLKTMAMYKRFETGEISVSVDGVDIFKIDSVVGINEFNDDLTFFSGSFDVNGIYSDLSKIPDEDARIGLAAVGLTTIEGKIRGEASWDLSDGRVKFEESSLDFKNIGRLNIKLDFSGYTLAVLEQMIEADKELRKIDPTSDEYQAKAAEMFMSAAAQLLFNEFTISFTDDGISTKILDIVAAQQGTTRQELVPGLAMMSSAFLEELGVPELQSQIREAVNAYLSDPKNIEIKIKPENPTPTMSFLALADNPPELIKLLNINVSANQ